MSKKKSLVEKLKEEAMIPEAYLVGLFWSNPELYGVYSVDKINTKTFLNKVWGFYFGLGRYMYEKGVTVFDDISVYKYVQECKQEDNFEKYGEFETINEMMKEVEGKEENVDAYYKEVKKNRLLLNLVNLLGEKVLEVDPDKKYDYHEMDKEEIFTYWSDKLNQIGMDGDTSFQEAFLLEGLDDLIRKLDEEPDIGLEFYNSKKMTEICNGMAKGCLYINGGFGGKGKTSMSFAKVIMSHIFHKEKLVVIANEQSLEDFQKMLLITAMGILGVGYGFKRQRINEGGFTDKEKQHLQDAINLVKAWTQGEDRLIVFVFLETYTMEFVKKVLTYYRNRGYQSVLIDTGKPSDDLGGMARWERFTEDFKELYKMIRPQALNMFCWVNVQLADSALNQRFLNEFALGESKKIKNEASVVFMGRHIWDDEYSGGKNELEIWNWVPKSETNNDPEFAEEGETTNNDHYEREYEDNVRYIDKDPNSPYKLKKFTLKRFDKNGNQNQFYLLFCSKNRRGQDNTTGLPVLVFKVNFNNNTWTELGWTTVQKDYNF
jgi:hypothetical protein